MKSKCCNAEIIEGNICTNCGDTGVEVDPFYTVKIKPISVNEMYIHKPVKTSRGWIVKRIKSPKYREWEKEFHYLLPDNLDIPDKIRMEYEFGFSSTRSDLDNAIKGTLDGLASKYGFNDNQVYKSSEEKFVVSKGNEFVRFRILEYKKKKWYDISRFLSNSEKRK